MAAPDAAIAYYTEQARITEAAIAAAASIWGHLDRSNPSVSWARDGIDDAIFLAVAQAQEVAALSADPYADLVLAQQGVTALADGQVIPSSVAGVASDGRSLDTLLLQPVITAAVAQASGTTSAEALASGLAALVRIVGTQVQDAGRAATSIAVATRGDAVGFVRMLVGDSCSRCIILAGRWYRYDAGFDRHPLCNCVGIPAAEDTSSEIRTDPDAYFRSLSKSEQDRAFTKAGAEAIRDGADLSQVVNARRGALGLDVPGRLTVQERAAGKRQGDRFRQLRRTDVYGQPVAITSEGMTIRGIAGKRLIESKGSTQEVAGVATRITRTGPELREVHVTRARSPRLMPEAIYEIAHDRADAVRLLRRFGYIT